MLADSDVPPIAAAPTWVGSTAATRFRSPTTTTRVSWATAPLRVINEDRVQPGKGFGTHGHSDMEIISYVLEGELAHRDSMGNGSVIRRGDVQRMSAGTGVQHSEFNNSPSAAVHFFQIWVFPDRRGLTPGYEEKHFDDDAKRGQLKLVASNDGREGSVVIHQNTDLYAALLKAGDEVTHVTDRTARGWVQVASGAVTVNGERLGDRRRRRSRV